MERNFKSYADKITQNVSGATKYLKNLNQDQNYRKGNNDESIILCRVVYYSD